MRVPLLITICLLCFTFAPLSLRGASENPAECTYSTYRWNVASRQAVNFERINHPYAELSEEEVDSATGCTLCEEDQELIRIAGVNPFRVCKKLASRLRDVMDRVVSEGEPIYEVTGYRVGRTKGEPDENGNRRDFSNHSYGTAIDINQGLNGLYDRCIDFGPGCRLIRGGEWSPGRPGSLTADSVTVRAMKEAGFKWGGEIAGKQKDFMHFSISGY